MCSLALTVLSVKAERFKSSLLLSFWVYTWTHSSVLTGWMRLLNVCCPITLIIKTAFHRFFRMKNKQKSFIEQVHNRTVLEKIHNSTYWDYMFESEMMMMKERQTDSSDWTMCIWSCRKCSHDFSEVSLVKISGLLQVTLTSLSLSVYDISEPFCWCLSGWINRVKGIISVSGLRHSSTLHECSSKIDSEPISAVCTRLSRCLTLFNRIMSSGCFVTQTKCVEFSLIFEKPFDRRIDSRSERSVGFVKTCDEDRILMNRMNTCMVFISTRVYLLILALPVTLKISPCKSKCVCLKMCAPYRQTTKNKNLIMSSNLLLINIIITFT